MKKGVFFVVVCLCWFAPIQTADAQAANPWAAIIKAAIKRVVRAVDLLIQRRQNAVIRLQNAQKVLENTMSKLHLDEIADWVRKQRDLYREYYEELKKVKAVIAYYFRIKQIAEKQGLIVEEYRRAFQLFQQDGHFSPEEIAYMVKGYAGILEETAKSVDVLTLVVKSFTTQMSDVKRLEIIDQASKQVDQLYDELLIFNRENQFLSLSRAKDEFDAKVTMELYGIQ